MKKNLLFLLAIGLAFTACQKESTYKADHTEVITIKGFKYPKDSIMNEFSKGLGMTVTEFYFDQERELFVLKDYDMVMEPETYLILKK